MTDDDERGRYCGSDSDYFLSAKSLVTACTRRPFLLGDIIMATRRTTRRTEDQTADERLAAARTKVDKDVRDRIEIGKTAPKFEDLVELAKKFPPPQEWWDEDFEGL
jgi:hypothetical protein